MKGAASAKTLLKAHNKKKYANFLLNTEQEIALPAISSVPWISGTSRRDIYKKTLSHEKGNHVCFLTKNDHHHGFLWKTTSAQIQQGVRWGIIKPESVTGKVISALGHYRITTHERIAKGMQSNTQWHKLKLLDHYQDRFEALQELESLVNKNNDKSDYRTDIEHYITSLLNIKQNLDTSLEGLEPLRRGVLRQIKLDIDNDIARAQIYLDSLKDSDSLRAFNRARGHNSILEFVKQQMVHNLYELQGFNQDITYSQQRKFALTRGEMNDFIEDARKEIDDYRSDPRNAVNATHHGKFSPQSDDSISYDFSKEALGPNRERQILLGISFIEGWDKVDYTNPSQPVVSNESGTESLSTITATRWQTHRNALSFFKSFGFYLLNIIKSFFVSTRPWEEEAWKNSNFHLEASALRKNVKSHDPMWLKPLGFLKQGFHALVDVFKGIKNFGANLVIKLPSNIINDWASTNELPSFEQVLQQAGEEISGIERVEHGRLTVLLEQCHYHDDAPPPAISKLAMQSYHLTPGEQNDLLTAMVRGVEAFGSVFTHTIFAKDPIAGLLFTGGYLVGAAAIYFPVISASLFGAAYVNWFSAFSYTMGSSKLAAVIGGGSTQAQLFASAWDVLMHGPSSISVQTIAELAEDPLTVAVYFGAAYWLGYVLANGIGGHPIPWLSEALISDLGSVPETGYPLIGAKVAIAIHEALQTPPAEEYVPVSLPLDGTELDSVTINKLISANYKTIEKFALAHWLSKNAAILPQLKDDTLFNIARQIDAVFTTEEATSLKKLLYPEQTPSIAFQLFSIPLTYIPAVLRVLISIVLSPVAWLMEKPHWQEPCKRASKDLGNKVAKDLNRLVVCAVDVVHFTYSNLAIFCKITAFTANMAIGRLTSLFNKPTGHLFHQIFGEFHNFFRTVGEFFYPARVTKSVVFAHPSHTIIETAQSYKKLVMSLGEPVKAESLKLDQSGSFSLLTQTKSAENIRDDLNLTTQEFDCSV